MNLAEAQCLVRVVGGVDRACRDRDVLCSAVAAAARLRAWLDGQEVGLAAQLAEVVAFPEQAIADAARSSLRDAGRVLDRAHTLESMPVLGDAAADGGVSGAQVDVIGKALRRLEPELRRALIYRASWLAGVAASTSADEFAQLVAGEVRRIQRDDGVTRLERQGRATRLSEWIDGEGMWCLSGRFDPETGLRLHGRLAASVDTLFAEQTPAHCPSNPRERQGFLRAHALVALTEGRGGDCRRPEVVVVVDTTAPGPNGGTVDWGLPVELPAAVLHTLFDRADLYPVIVHDGVALRAPGQLDLGRSTRLANRAQRRALRALYPTCAVPACATRFELCKFHHVTPWEHGGPTDLHNLLPVCVQHHHSIHDHGWQLTLDPHRNLTITYPDGRTQTTRPPHRRRCHGPPAA